MNKKFHMVALAALFMTSLFSGCMTTSSSKAAGGADDFHINRFYQNETIPAGSVIGILNTGPDSSAFLSSALQEAGLQVRQYDLYSLIAATDLARTSPDKRFVYRQDLSEDASTVVVKAAEDAAAEGAGSTDINVDALIDRLIDLDDITVEEQRINHYLALKARLRELLDSMSLDYIIVVNGRYVEHNYITSIYKTSNLDLIFSHYLVANTEEWRTLMTKPVEKENLSYAFANEQEPTPFYDLVYAEYLANILDIQ